MDKRTLEIIAGILQVKVEMRANWRELQKWTRLLVEEIQAQTAYEIILANDGQKARAAVQAELRGGTWSKKAHKVVGALVKTVAKKEERENKRKAGGRAAASHGRTTGSVQLARKGFFTMGYRKKHG